MTKGADKKDGEKLFTKRCQGRIRGDDFKWEEDRFRPDIRKKFFSVMVMGHWKRLSQSACGCLSPESAQGQVGQRSEQPGVVKDVGRGVGKNYL